MAKKHFEKEIKRVSDNIDIWKKRLDNINQQSMTEMIDEDYKAGLESAIRRELYRLECLLYVKRLLDMPTKKKKQKVFNNTSKLPKGFPD